VVVVSLSALALLLESDGNGVLEGALNRSGNRSSRYSVLH
jgi:hypothetical protein